MMKKTDSSQQYSHRRNDGVMQTRERLTVEFYEENFEIRDLYSTVRSRKIPIQQLHDYITDG